jgi:outer membrane protein OmpA-like peptidoglycan-associated protein
LGSDNYNAKLSNQRADAIREALILMGVSSNQVVTEGFGESKPRRPNFNPDGSDNPTGRSENRRAEVYLDF